VFDVADNTLRLQRLHLRAHQLAGQDRVFALILENAAVARLARQVHTAAQGHVVALIAQFRADQRAVLARQFQVPCRCFRLAGWQCRRIPSEHSAARHAHRRVRHL
jgi:hypothetical protein